MNKETLNNLIKEITNNPQALIDININDVRGLFNENEEINNLDASVNASADGRMKHLTELVKRNVIVGKKDVKLLFYFFFPENLPLMMAELFQFTKWIDTIPGRYTIRWGMAKHSAQELRIIILWQ